MFKWFDDLAKARMMELARAKANYDNRFSKR